MAKGYRAAIQYVAMNDEPICMDIEEMKCMPSVQVVAVAFGKDYETVAAAVVRYRERFMQD